MLIPPERPEIGEGFHIVGPLVLADRSEHLPLADYGGTDAVQLFIGKQVAVLFLDDGKKEFRFQGIIGVCSQGGLRRLRLINRN
jgi:hypothetical protein